MILCACIPVMSWAVYGIDSRRYDGPSKSAPLLTTLAGGFSNVVVTSSVNGTSMYLWFTSDGSVTSNGFNLEWQCTLILLLVLSLILFYPRLPTGFIPAVQWASSH